MSSKVEPLTVCVLVGLLAGLAAATYVSAQMPALPQLSDVEVEALASTEPGSDILSYEYRVRHLGSDLVVESISLDVSSDASRARLDASDLSFVEPFFTATTQLNLSKLGPQNVVAIAATGSPDGWASGIDVEARVSWGAIRDDAGIAPGDSAMFAAASRGLPVIRSLLVRPDIFDFLPNFDETDVTLEEYRAATEASNLVLPSIGPQGPPSVLDLPAFASEIVSLRSGAEENGWVRAGAEVDEVDRLLGDVRTALQDGKLGTARSAATAFIALVESISCTTFDCPTETPIKAEGRALLAINMEFLRSKLPANAPPVADAGLDQVVECASAGATTVMLDGSGSTDPDGDPLAFQWSGPFGIATGPKPTVILPLGTSEVGLVVNDGEFDSAPDTVSIVSAVRVEGLAPPLSALVKDSEPTPVPDQALKQGRTAPLKLNLFCGAGQLTDAEVAPPDLISIERDGDALNLATLDLDSGEANDSGTAFRSSEGQWVYNLSTRDLATGTYRVTIEMPDGLRYAAGFVAR